MNKQQMEQKIHDDVIKWAWEKVDPSKMTDYKNTRVGKFINIADTNANDKYENDVFEFMRAIFHPAIVEVLINDNWDYFKGAVGNICGHVAGYGAIILSKIFPEWEIEVVTFRTNSSFQRVNHSVIFGGPEGQKRVIDLDRKDVESIWWNVCSNNFTYPTVGKYTSPIGITHYSVNEFITEIIPESSGLFTLDKSPDQFISQLNIVLGSYLEHLIAQKPA